MDVDQSENDDFVTRTMSRRSVLKVMAGIPMGAVLLDALDSSDASAKSKPTTSKFKGVTLNVWSGVTVGPPMKKAAAEWSKKTGGKVIVTVVPGSERAIKFGGLIASRDSSIDLLYSSGQFVQQFGTKLYQDLSGPRYAVDKRIYVPGTLSIMSYRGKLVALPLHSELYIYIFNKKLFAAAGIDPARPPKTWAQYYAAAGKLRAGGKFGCASAWANVNSAAYYLCYLNSIKGAKLLSNDRTQVLFGDSKGLKAFQAIEHGFTSGFYLPSLGADIEDYALGTMFNEGKIASMINFSELWGYAVGSDPKNFPTTLHPNDVGAGTLPGIASGTTGSINGYEGFGINKFSQKQAAALSLLKFATGPQFQLQMNLAKTLPSSNVAVLNSPRVKEIYPVGHVIARQGAGNVDRYGAPFDWTPPVQDALRRLYAGQINARQAHADSVAGVKKIVVKYLST